ncbi:POK8 protein, partial [Eolophus roseicapillus]|nr:POK8 protein [Eolophus roseicapilla]
QSQEFEELLSRSEKPVEGITVFTDAGRKSRRGAVTWQEEGQWFHHILPGENNDSLQTLELKAVVWVFQKWYNQPINVVSDSLYVVGVTQCLERAMVKQIKNKLLHALLL